MAISRMQEPRQLYGLGSLVKKAVRGVKKIVKSPIGKAALGIGLGAYAGGFGPFSSGGALSGVKGAGFLRNLGTTMPALFANPNSPHDMRNIGFFPKMFGKMTTGQKIFGGLGAAAIATPFIQKAMGVGPYEEIVEEEVDENYIDPYTAVQMAKARDPYMNFLPDERFVQSGFYQPVANGGRIGYANGEMVEGDMQLPPEAEKFLRQEYQKYVAQGGDLSYPEFKMMVLSQASGEQGPEQEEVMSTEAETIQTEPQMPMMMAEGGLMNLGGMEKDYRAEGGFVPIGKREKADDVPARLSVNEFVFTADAVRNAGGGDIDKGAEVMENLMDHLEAGGKVSEESQGAQAMYDNMKQLETRVV